MAYVGLEADFEHYRTRHRCAYGQRQLCAQHVKGIIFTVDILTEDITLALTIDHLGIL